MAIEVRLPKLSDEIKEATISRWLKDVGDSVEKGEPIVEVETEKVIVEVEAPRAGVILEIVAPEQTLVAVDDVICRLGAVGERTQAPAAPSTPLDPRPATPDATIAHAPAVSVSESPAPQAAVAQGAVAAAASSPVSNVVSLPQRGTAGASLASAGAGQSAVAASPLARRVAEDLALDLTVVRGTGIGGKIVMADLQPYLPPPETAAVDAAQGVHAPAQATRQSAAGDAPPAARPHTPLRRTIARRMAESKASIPHFYMTADVDVTEVLALRTQLNTALDKGAVGRISVNDLMLKAAALALEAEPSLNAVYSDDALHVASAVHLAFATAIDDGLVTPVIRDCHLKSIGRIAHEARELAERARSRTLTAEELQGGTFTVSNLGMYEVVEFAAIINPPQVGILAVARPEERPVAVNGRVVLRKRLRVTLSADHRAVDGVTGARFLAAFKATLEHPERLML